MTAKTYQLIVRAGPNPGKVYPIMRSEISIGRDPASDVLINDAEISRRHAVIKMIPEGYTIEDLGSTNGTIINNQRIVGPHLLRSGEMIYLGEHIALIFEAQQVFDPDATLASARAVPPAPPSMNKPVQVQYSNKPGEAPYGSGIPSVQVPVTRPVPEEFPPEDEIVEEAPPAKKKIPRWLLFVLIGVVAVSCMCFIAVLIYIDSNFLWCKILPILPGCLVQPASALPVIPFIG
jgi:hypothetical protein